MHIQGFFDDCTGTWSYLVWEPVSRDAIVIDPIIEYDPVACTVSSTCVQKISAVVKEHRLKLHFSLETHAHADHLTGAQFLKSNFTDMRVAIGNGIRITQSTFKRLLSFPDSFLCDGSQFDQLINHNETIHAGSIAIRAISTPGHTPSCMSYQVGDNLFVGDCIFMPDCGTGRCDFPDGSATDLYDSITKQLYAFDDHIRIYTCHDYPPDSRDPRMWASVGEQKSSNVHLPAHISQEEFVQFRSNRDQGLSNPRLLFPSIQVNIQAGILPEPDHQGNRFLKMPLNVLD